MIERAEARCGPRAAEPRQVHGYLIETARRLEPPTLDATESPATGAQIRAHVEVYLDQLATACVAGDVAAWLRPKVEHLVTVLRRLGCGLYHCYDVPGLPRTDLACPDEGRDLEQFFRRVKADQRRITGRKRADAFVVRVGGFAVYATAAGTTPTTSLLQALATVPADAWQRERLILRANQGRQTKMRRFRLRRATYLADLEARWTHLTELP